ncbi:MAG: heme lyase CcmF/NrfE family subunit [Actinobacteria bacterium]|nr:heme lyase CcmF/NrfE family subunit [Actinomycetota bacterium]
MISLAGLGRPSLLAALVLAFAALVLHGLGALRSRKDLTEAGIRATIGTAVFVGIAVVSLVSALYVHDFSLDYVARYSSRSLPGPYTITALWGGMEGSLLFWALLLTTFSAVALRRVDARTTRLVGWAGAVLAGIALFFLALLVMPANPFTRLADVPVDGAGLNPLLQSPGMVIHPPLLYTGFVGFSIPFAFAMAALFSGHLDDSWLKATRRWTLFAWSALSIGIVLGGAWAYTELGWGGYWAWDPVENASFMPWLTATAFLHSVVIQEKRRMFKVWNVVLILLTYVLAVFGTFLTRSGILSSIHTFTEGSTGKWFLPFLGGMLLGSLGVVAARYEKLRSDNRFDSLLSRESAFLLNNVLFVAAALTVLWGTIYPIVAEATSGVRLTVGPPFFNSVFIPVGLAIVCLTGIGPLISWRRMSSGSLTRIVRVPLLAGASIAIALAIAGVRSTGALLAFSLCTFTATAIGSEFVRGSSVYRGPGQLSWPAALLKTLLRNRRRYGGYVVHLGVILIVIGLSGSAFSSERQELLSIGESTTIGDYTLTYETLRQDETDEKQINEATLIVSRGGEEIATMRPQRNFHFAQEQPQSEVAIRTTPVEDLYVVITSFDQDGTAAVRAFINPLTWWIWAGAAVMLVGMGVLLSSEKPVEVGAPARKRAPEKVAVTQ